MNIKVIENTIDLFKVVVAKKSNTFKPDFDLLEHGIITDFVPDELTKAVLKAKFGEIKAVGKKLQGRINKDCVIVRVK